MMTLIIDPAGQVHCLYAEEIDLRSLGVMSIARASHLEPDELGQWQADLSPVAGPTLDPFALRSEALAAERDWLDDHLASLPAIPWPT